MKRAVKIMVAMFVVISSILISGKNVEAQGVKTYEITYAPGQIASFSEDYLQKAKSFGAEISADTGSVTFIVAAGGNYPMVPTAADIVFGDPEDSLNYYLKTEWMPQGRVDKSKTFVLDYGALTTAVEYTVRYVDEVSKEDVEAPMIAFANSGDILTFSAKQIENYKVDEEVKSITISDSAKENVICFYYTSTLKETGEVVTKTITEYETVVQYETETIIVPGTHTTTVTPAQGNAGGNNGGGVMENPAEPDEENGIGEEAENSSENVIIEDQETPLSGDNEDLMVDIYDEEVALDSGLNEGAMGGITASVAVLLLAVSALIIRRKTKKDTTE